MLVVEDHADAAESLRLLLELEGHEVRVAATGPDGVEVAAKFRPDVVLCDLGLPGLDGYEVVAVLRSHPATAAVPVATVTGYALDEDRERCRAAGFTALLAKPVCPDVLRPFVAGVARRATAPRADGPTGPRLVASAS